MDILKDYEESLLHKIYPEIEWEGLAVIDSVTTGLIIATLIIVAVLIIGILTVDDIVTIYKDTNFDNFLQGKFSNIDKKRIKRFKYIGILLLYVITILWVMYTGLASMVTEYGTSNYEDKNAEPREQLIINIDKYQSDIRQDYEDSGMTEEEIKEDMREVLYEVSYRLSERTGEEMLDVGKLTLKFYDYVIEEQGDLKRYIRKRGDS